MSLYYLIKNILKYFNINFNKHNVTDICGSEFWKYDTIESIIKENNKRRQMCYQVVQNNTPLLFRNHIKRNISDSIKTFKKDFTLQNYGCLLKLIFWNIYGKLILFERGKSLV